MVNMLTNHRDKFKALDLLEEETIITQTYSDEPNGVPEPNRVANGEPAFLHRSLTTKQVIKSIVIADPTLLNKILDFKYLSDYIVSYQELNKLNCQIYFWDGQQLIFYDAEKEFHSDFSSNFMYHVLQIPSVINKNAILEAARNKKISTDHVRIADEKFHQNSQFYTSAPDYIFSRTIASLDQILRISKGMKKNVTFYISPRHSELPSSFPILKNIINLGVRKFDIKIILELIRHAPNLIGMMFEGGVSYPTLKEIYFVEGTTLPTIIKNIKTLEISKCKLSMNMLPRVLNDFSQINNLILSEVVLEDDKLSQIELPSIKLRCARFYNSKILRGLVNSNIRILEIYTDNEDHIEELTSNNLRNLQALSITTNNWNIFYSLIQILPKDLKVLFFKSDISISQTEMNDLLKKFNLTCTVFKDVISPPEDKDNKSDTYISIDTSPSSKDEIKQHSSFSENKKDQPKADEINLNADTNESMTVFRNPVLFKTNNADLDETSLYRLQVYNKLDKDIKLYSEHKWEIYKDYKITQNLEKDFEDISNIKPKNLAWSSIEIYPHLKKQILFSLSPNEKITHIQINSSDPNVQVKLFYDKKTRLYAAESSQRIQLKYMLEVNRQIYSDKQKINPKRKEIIEKYKSFKPGDLKLTKPIALQELIKVIKEKRLGTCLHRSIACYDDLIDEFLATYPNYPIDYLEDVTNYATFVGSNSHAFIEIFDSTGLGFTVDLGGTPAITKKIPFNPNKKFHSCLTDNATVPDTKNKPFFFSSTSLQNETKSRFNIEEMKKYERPKPTLSQHSTKEFFTDLLSFSNKPILLLTNSEDQIHGLINEAVSFLRENKKDNYYIDDLDEFNEPAVRHFLNNTVEEAVLFIRWDKNKKIKPEHVGLNSLFDVPPMLEGKKIPKNLKLIALAEQNSTLTEDVRSRFRGRILPVPSQIHFASGKAENIGLQKNITEKPPGMVNLCSSLDWKKKLIGDRIYKEGENIFIPGKLLNFIQENYFSRQENKSQTPNLEFRILNPPWFLDEFKVFWNRLQKERRYFADGKFHAIPEGLLLTWANSFFKRPNTISIKSLNVNNSSQWQYVLNQETFKRFFSIPVSQINDSLNIKSGYLAESKELTILVTDHLLEGQWEELLTKAEELGCKLNLIVAPYVNMPEILKLDSVKAEEKETKEVKAESKEMKEHPIKIMTSNDPSFLIKEDSQNTILFLSNDSNYKLVENWKAVSLRESKTINYINQEGILFNLLKEGKNVILTGEISSELSKRLQTLLANPPYLEYNGIKAGFGSDKMLKGKLSIVVKTNPFPFSNIPHITVPVEDYFKDVPKEEAELLKTLCDQLGITIQYYSQVQTMLVNLKKYPENNPIEWLLMLDKSPESKLEMGKKLYQRLRPQLNKEIKEEKNKNELHIRMKEMVSRLENNPFLFLIGPSGTGKSTTVIQELPNFYKEMKKEIRTFASAPPELENIKEWAQAKDNTIKFLFIDEANLAEEETYAFVEGMLKKPPEIIYNGERFELTENHKIIFAGNYQYYVNRHNQNLFLKYDCIQHFPAFSPQYIQENLVLPLINSAFKSMEEKTNQHDAKRVLDIFSKCMLDTREIMQDVNLTVRNLQAMALAFGRLWNDSTLFSSLQKNERIDLFAKWAFYQNARDALGHHDKILKSKLFGSMGKYDELKFLFPRVRRGDLGSVYITSPHKRPIAVLEEELQVREIRQKTSFGLSSGTCGILLGGVPGIGKSSLVINKLEKLGFKNALEYDAKTEIKSDGASKLYYHITPTNPNTVKKILLEAFHKGATVVIDEINTFPLESLLNSLMMGVDNKGQLAQRKGFFVIGTYNPIGSGRRILSQALENRFRKIELLDYTEKDLNKFLTAKYKDIPENVREYFSYKYAQAKNTSEPYNFRDLLSDVEYAKEKVTETTKSQLIR